MKITKRLILTTYIFMIGYGLFSMWTDDNIEHIPINFENGISSENIHPCMWKAISISKRIYKLNNEDFYITSTTGGIHAPNSLHYEGKAIDVRTRTFNIEKQNRIYNEIKNALGNEYFVINEFNPRHIHIGFIGE